LAQPLEPVEEDCEEIASLLDRLTCTLEAVKLAVRILWVMLSLIAGWVIGSVLGLVITLAVIASDWGRPVDPWVVNAALALGWVGGIAGLLIGLRLTGQR
jgi:hypothetical protein